MISFAKGMFFDLSFQAIKMIENLEIRKNTGVLHKDIPDLFYQKAISQLSNLLDEVQAIINSGDLELESIMSNNLVRYNTFHERFQAIELFQYEVIVKYGDAEHYFNNKIKRIYDEIQNVQVPPIVTTISNSENYYWAHPYYSIIAVPFGEEAKLLNLPDLYHEICHLIYKQYSNSLIGNFKKDIKTFYEEEIIRVDDEGRSPELKTIFQETLQKWLAAWIEEFTCDLMATFLVGTAYAWTNLKLSTISSRYKRVYMHSESHPSDEARMRAIFLMLTLNSQGDKAKTVNTSWDTFLKVTTNPMPDNYNFLFPDHLIDKLANYVFKGCKAIGLSNYDLQIQKFGNPISKILNDSWNKLLDNPGEFKDWESKVIAEIKAQF